MNKIILLLFLMCNLTFVFAQKKSAKSKTFTHQISSTKALEQKLDSLFSSFNTTTPGVAVTVLKEGKVIVKKALYLITSFY